MNRRESPFEETALLRQLMPNVLLQTSSARPTSGLPALSQERDRVCCRRGGHRRVALLLLPERRAEHALCGEVVMKRGRLFEPTISLPWPTDHERVLPQGGAGHRGPLRRHGRDRAVCEGHGRCGDVTRIGNLINAVKQAYPGLVINYHRHITDGLAIPAMLSAAKAGASIFDVEEDSLVRFYGHSPILAVQAIFEESAFRSIWTGRRLRPLSGRCANGSAITNGPSRPSRL